MQCDDRRKLPLMRCPDGVVGADAMTTALRMVGSPPPMMDGPSDCDGAGGGVGSGGDGGDGGGGGSVAGSGGCGGCGVAVAVRLRW